MASPALRVLLSALLLAVAEGLRRAPWDGELSIAEAEEREGIASLQDVAVDAIKGDDTSWEWAVTEAVQEAHPLKLSAPAQGSTLAAGRHSPPSSVPPPWKPLVWIYGAHHKSGTDLLRSLAIEHAKLLNVKACLSYGKYGFYPRGCATAGNRTARLWMRCSLSYKFLQELYFAKENFRSVHIMRDPIALVVSGYIYHMKNPDTPAELMVERSMSMAEGLKVEAQYVLNVTGQAMVDTYQYARELALHVRFETFTRNSGSFDDEVKRMYNYMLGDQLTREQHQELHEKARAYDLRRSPGHHSPGHVADPEMKRKVREVLDQLPAEMLAKLKEMRRSLGYE